MYWNILFNFFLCQVRRIHNKRKKKESKLKKGNKVVAKFSICKGNISATLIVFSSDGRTISGRQRGTIKGNNFSFQKKDNMRLQLKSFPILETLRASTSPLVYRIIEQHFRLYISLISYLYCFLFFSSYGNRGN